MIPRMDTPSSAPTRRTFVATTVASAAWMTTPSGVRAAFEPPQDAVYAQITAQHAATVTQLAHEWAEARRAHLMITGPANHANVVSYQRLSGLANRLERACLGPRPKKEAPT